MLKGEHHVPSYTQTLLHEDSNPSLRVVVCRYWNSFSGLVKIRVKVENFLTVLNYSIVHITFNNRVLTEADLL